MFYDTIKQNNKIWIIRQKGKQMYYLIFTLIGEFLIDITCIASRLILSKFERKGHFRLLYGKKHRWLVGMIAGWLLSVISIFIYLAEIEKNILYIATTSIYLPLFLIFSWIWHIVIYDETGFERGFLPGIRHYYRYEEITGWQYNKYEEIIIIGNTKIRFDFLWIDSRKFTDYALRKYRHIYGENPPTETNIPSRDLFCGNIKKPNDLILVGILLLLLTLAIPFLSIYRIYDTIDVSNSDYIEVDFTSFETNKDTLVLRTDEYKTPFYIWDYLEYETIRNEQLFEMIESGKSFQVYAKYIGGRSSSSYIIYNLSDETGDIYVSFEKANENDNEHYTKFLPFSWIFPAGWLLICTIVVLIVRKWDKIQLRIKKGMIQ